MDSLDHQILHYISESRNSVSFRRLHQRFKYVHQLEAKPLKQAVKRLVQEGRLCYRTDFGSTYLDIAMNGPVKISEHVFLKPPASRSIAGQGEWEILLEKGAAFGRGDHPTTRLAIQLIDDLLHDTFWKEKKHSIMAIDIGTGSGVLAIVAAVIGVGRVKAVDIDPCAIFEARANIQLNKMEKQVVLIDDLQQVDSGCCDLILANLRTPTLMGFLPKILDLASIDSTLIFSGMRTDETVFVCDRYRAAGFFQVKLCSEKDWSALILSRGDFLRDTGKRTLGY
ncbi:50S ribosomal protein L11 methyltransferase [uncultured Desulfosarcina sp.]|uniref:50S ribosomal protein L11 methyltransferase n=1 Tax=uncultured Desulfosarcina sp. TaxID=218289 RepID=UPI0029C6270E|nr:50S ribosomal protein L11 methyltransferase [uncultured Desulfosarcina sp.]